jgi:hypothetical protein
VKEVQRKRTDGMRVAKVLGLSLTDFSLLEVLGEKLIDIREEAGNTIIVIGSRMQILPKVPDDLSGYVK